MSFCCGASMIGTKGTLKYFQTQIHNIPLLLCPICHRTEVHYLIASEYEILAEYAHGDGAAEVNFLDYVDSRNTREIYENCINIEHEELSEMIRNQIDMSLDLLVVAKQLADSTWEDQLKNRLRILGRKRAKLARRNLTGGSR